MTTQTVQPQETHETHSASPGGLPVRTDLHAGRACWDPEMAAKVANQVMNTISAFSTGFGGNCPLKPPA